MFRDGRGVPLYVGTSRNLRTRVRQYFVASEMRTRMGEMVALAERVDPISCAHALEAQVRELRLIAAHKPRYNRRSKYPERSVWLKLTHEAFPRLSVVRVLREDGSHYLGPLRSQRQAEAVRDAIHDAVPLRQCSDRLSLRRAVRAACALAGIGRCSAPCEGGTSPADYAALVDLVAAAWTGDVRPLVEPLRAKLARLSAEQRFEQAAVVRDRIATVVRACARMQRVRSVSSIDELVAARPDGAGGWEISVVRRGRLAAAGVAARGVPPYAVIEALLATADAVSAEQPVLAEETETILRWLEQPGTRLVHSLAAVAAAGARRRRHGVVARGRRRPARRNPVRRPPRAADAVASCPRQLSTSLHAPLPRPRVPLPNRRDAPGYDLHVITAIVMISVESDKIPEVAQQIADVDGVSEVYSVAGDVDLIAVVRVKQFDDIADTIAGRLSKVDGVLHTDTHIAFRAYSRHDLESTFSLGVE